MTIGAGWYLVHEIFLALTRITEKAGGGEWWRRNPHIQKTVSSLSSPWISWENGAEVGYGWREELGLLMPLAKETHCWFKVAALNIDPRPLITFPVLNRLMTHWELFNHFHCFPHNFFFHLETSGGSPLSPWPMLSWRPVEGVPQNSMVAARCQYEVQISTSLESFWQEISVGCPQTLECIGLSWRASLIPGESIGLECPKDSAFLMSAQVMLVLLAQGPLSIVLRASRFGVFWTMSGCHGLGTGPMT